MGGFHDRDPRDYTIIEKEMEKKLKNTPEKMGRTSALVALGVANAWNVGRWAARGTHIIILGAQATFIEIAWKALEGRLLWAPVLQTPKKKLYSSF